MMSIKTIIPVQKRISCANDKYKSNIDMLSARENRRLLWQALAIFSSLGLLFLVLHMSVKYDRSTLRLQESPLSSYSAAQRFGAVSEHDDAETLLLSFPPDIRLDDIHISVKTSHKFHQDRLSVVVDTWYQLAKEQTWFFTDREDEDMSRQTSEQNLLTKLT